MRMKEKGEFEYPIRGGTQVYPIHLKTEITIASRVGLTNSLGFLVHRVVTSFLQATIKHS